MEAENREIYGDFQQLFEEGFVSDFASRNSKICGLFVPVCPADLGFRRAAQLFRGNDPNHADIPADDGDSVYYNHRNRSAWRGLHRRFRNLASDAWDQHIFHDDGILGKHHALAV